MINGSVRGASPPLLEVEALRVWLRADGGVVRAVDGVSFAIRRGETFALLGESGCGKSMTALAVMQLLPENGLARIDGAIRFGGVDLLDLPEREMRRVRGARIAMVFQEPALNPVMTVGAQVGEAVRRRGLRGAAAATRVVDLLDAVGMPTPRRLVDEYPHRLSGGMQQRAMLAISLAAEPELLIADEPTTALDVALQAQILALLRRLQRRVGIAILLITHDVGVAAEMADQAAVMYAGHLVETAPRERFFARPVHPYARALFASLPSSVGHRAALPTLEGRVPALTEPFSGCRFRARCAHAWAPCAERAPAWIGVGAGQRVRCFLADPEIVGPCGAADGPFPTAFVDPLSSENSSSRSDAVGPCGAADGPFPTAFVDSPSSENGSSRSDAVGPCGAADASSQTASAESLCAVDDGAAFDSEGGSAPVLEVTGLRVRFPRRTGLLRRSRGAVQAVDGVDFAIHRGRALALVGESGCGKTTIARALLRLIPPAVGEVRGRVRFEGESLFEARAARLRALRRRAQIIFQDPYAALNPRMTAVDLVGEGLDAQRLTSSRAARDARVAALLEQVGLPATAMGRYAHEFSGGQRQRLCIARALAVEPQLLICDEPTSALDLSVQAQILNLLHALQRERGIACLFITHDLSVAAWFAHDAAVMYRGRIVERGPASEALGRPRHPYAQALRAAVPDLARARQGGEGGDERSTEARPSIAPLSLSSASTPTGCGYRLLCPRAEAICREQAPAERRVGVAHYASCHFAHET